MSVRYDQSTIEELQELDRKYFLHPTTPIKQHYENGPSNIFTEGDGIYLTDVQGDRYIDGMASLWNVNIGHGREEMGEVAKRQIAKLAYSSAFASLSHEPVIRLSERMAALAPGDLNVSFFTSGGSEANDTAFKLVRHYWKLKGQPQRSKIIGRGRGYHGVSIGAASATGIPQFQDMATAVAPDFLHASPEFKTNCELGDKSDPDYETSIRGLVEKEGPHTIAAIIAEPVQGAGGVNIPPDDYFQAVRKVCDEYGILMIADEVICGFGRTGKMFGMNNWDVVPDVMTVAKGITSGYIQLGAVVISQQLREELAELSADNLFHGFTYSGHPTACALALKNIEILQNEALANNAKQMEAELIKGFKYLEENHVTVTKSRAIGLMAAFELFADPDSKKPFDPEVNAAPRVVQECWKRKLIVRPVTYGGTNIVVMAPPLVINKAQIEDMINIFSDAVAAFEKEEGFTK